jgi:hypothetical protein
VFNQVLCKTNVHGSRNDKKYLSTAPQLMSAHGEFPCTKEEDFFYLAIFGSQSCDSVMISCCQEELLGSCGTGCRPQDPAFGVVVLDYVCCHDHAHTKRDLTCSTCSVYHHSVQT